MKIRKVCYIADSPIPSRRANSIQIMKMCDAFARKGLQVELLLPAQSISKGCDFEKVHNIWHFYGIKNRFNIKKIPNYTLHFKNVSFNVLATLFAKLINADFVFVRERPEIAAIAINFNVPVIYETHYISYKKVVPILHLLQQKRRIGLVVISKWAAYRYEKMGCPHEKILYAHDGVDLTQFNHTMSKKEARKELNLPSNKTIVCYAGHLYRGKGIETILSCAKMMPNLLFMLVGGQAHDIIFYKELALRQNLKNVLFTGFVYNTQIPMYLYSADVLVLPQYKNTEHKGWMSPLKLFEYMAACRPIIATNLPTIKEVLVHHHNAILIEPEDQYALYEAIKFILENKTFAEEIAQNAYNDVKNFTWDKRVEKILAFLHKLL